MRNLKHCTKGSNVAKHAWALNHAIDFEKSLTKQTIGVERHWSHGTRQKPLGRTIICARSLGNITFS